MGASIPRFALLLIVCVSLGSGMHNWESICELPQSLTHVIPAGEEPLVDTQEKCEALTGCWDYRNGKDVCAMTKRDIISRVCSTIQTTDRLTCLAPNQLLCTTHGCCWDQNIPGNNKCYQKKFDNPCAIAESDREDCGTSNADTCHEMGCCYNLEDSGLKCYRQKGCNMTQEVHGPCSRTCGLAVRVVFNGCYKHLRVEDCCVRPCTAGGTGPSQPPEKRCADYEPYKTTRQLFVSSP